MENAITFGAQAEAYSAARPQYPDELFDWIASNAPGRDRVWDVGTGSGQAALSLAGRFDHVHATDIDAAQLGAAAVHPGISFHQSPAHISKLQDASADAITAATALHWFDFKAFWPEVQRAAKPGALFCAWTYHRIQADAEIREMLVDPVLEIIDPYWAEGNRISWRGYEQRDVAMPFERLTPPKFVCTLKWAPRQIAAFAASWSAHKKARSDGHEGRLEDIESAALSKLGDEPRIVRLPLHVIAARVDKA